MYVVIIIEHESDTPGVERVYGPFTTYELADRRRNHIRERLQFVGSVQVARVEPNDDRGNDDVMFGVEA
jgi:hypothetical protein